MTNPAPTWRDRDSADERVSTPPSEAVGALEHDLPEVFAMFDDGETGRDTFTVSPQCQPAFISPLHGSIERLMTVSSVRFRFLLARDGGIEWGR